jgi:hypothetical protein
MRWGALHPFALDCLAYLRDGDEFDPMTIVDSDQLALRLGYCEFLARHLPRRDSLGLLTQVPGREGPASAIAPCRAAHQEIDLWRPFLRRFEQGEDKFVHWSFWPSTVIGREAGFAILDLFRRDLQLQIILASPRLWATEEVLFPTLAALLGFDAVRFVEVGAYCGKATFILASIAKTSEGTARVLAIDRFDGVVGTLDRPESSGPTNSSACWQRPALPPSSTSRLATPAARRATTR